MSKELVRAGGNGAGFLAKLLGVAGATAASPVAAVAGIAVEAIADAICDRVEERQRERLEQIVKGLQIQLKAISDERLQDIEEERIDLFAESLKRFSQDDDARKCGLQSGYLAWLLESAPPLLHGRLVGEAIAGLCYEELAVFIAWANDPNTKRLAMPSDLNQAYTYRLASKGLLAAGTIIHANNVSAVGEAIKRIASEANWPHDQT